jgi:hypothetical protein
MPVNGAHAPPSPEFTPGNAEYLRLVRTIDHVIVAPNLTGTRRRQGPQANIS